jgi:anti-sigma factor ChrR (cupin superfamily)
MASEYLNADFTQRVVIDTTRLPWIPSPLPGVERRMLDRIGGEIARATSIVRYAPRSVFSAHEHALGEEFLVLEGVFSDESGDFSAGTYVRNPPGSRHAPSCAAGCIIFVKLRQMPSEERARVIIATAERNWNTGDVPGHSRAVLYEAVAGSERVLLERFAPEVSLEPASCPGGEEILVLEGELGDERGTYPAGTWIRNPDAHRRTLRSGPGCLLWVKRGHLQRAA